MTNKERLEHIGLGVDIWQEKIQLVQFKKPINEGDFDITEYRDLSDEEINSYAFYLIYYLITKKGKHQLTSHNLGKTIKFDIIDK